MSKFYVYQHKEPETGEVVYIGIGCKGRAWHSGTNTRSKEHSQWMNKIFESGGNPVHFISTGMTKKEACLIELPLINKENPKFNKLGTKSHRHKLTGITKEQAEKCHELKSEGLSYMKISKIVFPESVGAMQAWRAINNYEMEMLL